MEAVTWLLAGILAVSLIAEGAPSKSVKTLSLNDKDDGFEIYVFLKETSSPSVIIAHGCGGIKSTDHYQKWAKDINQWSFNAVIVDSFSKRERPDLCKDRAHFNIPPRQRAGDIQMTSSWIRQQDWHKGKVGAIGFSHGGSTMIEISESARRTSKYYKPQSEISNIDAVVAFYPACQLALGAKLKFADIPFQVHFGSEDTMSPLYKCTYGGFKGDNYEMYIYEGAFHVFDMIGRDRTSYGHRFKYDPVATKLAKERTKKFLDDHLK